MGRWGQKAKRSILQDKVRNLRSSEVVANILKVFFHWKQSEHSPFGYTVFKQARRFFEHTPDSDVKVPSGYISTEGKFEDCLERWPNRMILLFCRLIHHLSIP